jgi:hypothetical protein
MRKTKAQVVMLHKNSNDAAALEAWRRAGARIADAVLSDRKSSDGGRVVVDTDGRAIAIAEHRTKT